MIVLHIARDKDRKNFVIIGNNIQTKSDGTKKSVVVRVSERIGVAVVFYVGAIGKNIEIRRNVYLVEFGYVNTLKMYNVRGYNLKLVRRFDVRQCIAINKVVLVSLKNIGFGAEVGTKI